MRRRGHRFQSLKIMREGDEEKLPEEAATNVTNYDNLAQANGVRNVHCLAMCGIRA